MRMEFRTNKSSEEPSEVKEQKRNGWMDASRGDSHEQEFSTGDTRIAAEAFACLATATAGKSSEVRISA